MEILKGHLGSRGYRELGCLPAELHGHDLLQEVQLEVPGPADINHPLYCCTNPVFLMIFGTFYKGM